MYYADNNMPFWCGKSNEDVISQLEEDFCKLSKWFKLNCLKLNDDKSYLLVSNNLSDVNIDVGRYTITCSESVKLLGIRIENTNKKLHALASVSNYMTSAKLKTLMKSFVIS